MCIIFMKIIKITKKMTLNFDNIFIVVKYLKNKPFF